jgi:dTDP-4-dehydrorhamnose 3,5-epimerase
MGVAWNDPGLAIPWPVSEPIISEKDQRFPPLANIDPARLPRWKG